MRSEKLTASSFLFALLSSFIVLTTAFLIDIFSASAQEEISMNSP
jgi:hypothetical protein